MIDWNGTAAEVGEAIAEIGAEVTFTTPGRVDLTVFPRQPSDPTVRRARALLLNYTARERAQGAIPTEHRRLIVDPRIDPLPALNDAVSIFGETWQVVDDESVSPAGRIVVVDIRVARASPEEDA